VFAAEITRAATVTVGTTRGYVSVDPSPEERVFRVRVHIPGFAWEIGATDDPGLLAEMLAAWQEGVAFGELAARFEFLELDEFVRALEDGEPTSSQWSELLSSDVYRGQRDLLRRLHADEVLRTMFPVISHGAVRLRVDAMDRASRHVRVYEAEPGRYEARRPEWETVVWEEVPSGELITYLRARLIEEG